MPYDITSKQSARVYTSKGTRPPPYSNPPAVTVSQSISEQSTGRSGGLSPYIKGGILTTLVRSVKAYKAIIGYQWVPIVHRVYYRDRYGRRVYRKVIRHKRKNVWGIKTKVYWKKVRVRSPDPGLLLLPNNLTFNSLSRKERSGSSIFIKDMGQPYQLTIENFQTGALGGSMSGDATILGPSTDPFSSLPSLDSTFDELKRQALTRLYSKVQDEKANLALMAAEGAKTFGLMSDIFFSGIQLFRSLRRLELTKAARVIGASRQQIASRWLQYVYGVSPLISEVNKIISDIGGSSKAWRKYSTVASKTLKFRSSSQPPITGVSFDYEINLAFKTSVIVDTSISIPKASVAYGFSQPAAIAWELIPFSFVVDWFYPIGNWLSASHAMDSNVISYFETRFSTSKVNYESYHFISGSSLKGGGSGPGGSQYKVFCDRKIGAVPPMPTPSISKRPLSPARLANALALLNQRY